MNASFLFLLTTWCCFQNAKRITATKDNDEDIYDENMLASWDFEDLSHKQQDSIEKGSNFELIPELAKHMQRHQKHGFQFLWRNLAGQDANGNPCFPPREPGGCVISHAPGTGKTFLIISFLHSYIKVRLNSPLLVVDIGAFLQCVYIVAELYFLSAVLSVRSKIVGLLVWAARRG